MKFGVDITGPDLHIGHAVNLWLYRALQEAGHRLILVIGDFTTNVGDPALGRRATPQISPGVIAENAESYVRQVKEIVLDDPEVFEVRKNSEWLSAADRSCLQRLAGGSELPLYPMLQGYDSVVLRSDLTIVGADQFENESVGSAMQAAAGQPPQAIVATIVTPGIFGGPKQSKSLRNYIGLLHTPRKKFGLALGIPDDLVGEYFRIYTTLPVAEIESIEKRGAGDPKLVRMAFAKALVARYHGEAAAETEERWLLDTFRESGSPDEAPIVLVPPELSVYEILRRCFSREELSNSEIHRLLRQGAVRLGNERASNPQKVIAIPEGGLLLRIGKRRQVRLEMAKAEEAPEGRTF